MAGPQPRPIQMIMNRILLLYLTVCTIWRFTTAQYQEDFYDSVPAYGDLVDDADYLYNGKYQAVAPLPAGSQEKCAASRGLVRFPQLMNFNCSAANQAPRDHCMSDNDCCAGSFCCLAVCDGVTKCFNPVTNEFTSVLPTSASSHERPAAIGNQENVPRTNIPSSGLLGHEASHKDDSRMESSKLGMKATNNRAMNAAIEHLPVISGREHQQPLHSDKKGSHMIPVTKSHPSGHQKEHRTKKVKKTKLQEVNSRSMAHKDAQLVSHVHDIPHSNNTTSPLSSKSKSHTSDRYNYTDSTTHIISKVHNKTFLANHSLSIPTQNPGHVTNAKNSAHGPLQTTHSSIADKSVNPDHAPHHITNYTDKPLYHSTVHLHQIPSTSRHHLAQDRHHSSGYSSPSENLKHAIPQSESEPFQTPSHPTKNPTSVHPNRSQAENAHITAANILSNHESLPQHRGHPSAQSPDLSKKSVSHPAANFPAPSNQEDQHIPRPVTSSDRHLSSSTHRLSVDRSANSSSSFVRHPVLNLNHSASFANNSANPSVHHLNSSGDLERNPLEQLGRRLHVQNLSAHSANYSSILISPYSQFDIHNHLNSSSAYSTPHYTHANVLPISDHHPTSTHHSTHSPAHPEYHMFLNNKTENMKTPTSHHEQIQPHTIPTKHSHTTQPPHSQKQTQEISEVTSDLENAKGAQDEADSDETTPQINSGIKSQPSIPERDQSSVDLKNLIKSEHNNSRSLAHPEYPMAHNNTTEHKKPPTSHHEQIQPHPITTNYSHHIQPTHNHTQTQNVPKVTSDEENAKHTQDEAESDETTPKINFGIKSTLTPSIPKSDLYGADFKNPLQTNNHDTHSPAHPESRMALNKTEHMKTPTSHHEQIQAHAITTKHSHPTQPLHTQTQPHSISKVTSDVEDAQDEADSGETTPQTNFGIESELTPSTPESDQSSSDLKNLIKSDYHDKPAPSHLEYPMDHSNTEHKKTPTSNHEAQPHTITTMYSHHPTRPHNQTRAQDISEVTSDAENPKDAHEEGDSDESTPQINLSIKSTQTPSIPKSDLDFANHHSTHSPAHPQYHTALSNKTEHMKTLTFHQEQIQPHTLTTKYSHPTQPLHSQSQPQNISKVTSGVENEKHAQEEADSDETTPQTNLGIEHNPSPSIPESDQSSADLKNPIKSDHHNTRAPAHLGYPLADSSTEHKKTPTTNYEKPQPHIVTTKNSHPNQPLNAQTQTENISEVTSGVESEKDAREGAESDESTPQLTFRIKSTLTPSIPKSTLYGADLENPIMAANNSRSLGSHHEQIQAHTINTKYSYPSQPLHTQAQPHNISEVTSDVENATDAQKEANSDETTPQTNLGIEYNPTPSTQESFQSSADLTNPSKSDHMPAPAHPEYPIANDNTIEGNKNLTSIHENIQPDTITTKYSHHTQPQPHNISKVTSDVDNATDAQEEDNSEETTIQTNLGIESNPRPSTPESDLSTADSKNPIKSGHHNTHAPRLPEYPMTHNNVVEHKKTTTTNYEKAQQHTMTTKSSHLIQPLHPQTQAHSISGFTPDVENAKDAPEEANFDGITPQISFGVKSNLTPSTPTSDQSSADLKNPTKYDDHKTHAPALPEFPVAHSNAIEHKKTPNTNYEKTQPHTKLTTHSHPTQPLHTQTQAQSISRFTPDVKNAKAAPEEANFDGITPQISYSSKSNLTPSTLKSDLYGADLKNPIKSDHYSVHSPGHLQYHSAHNKTNESKTTWTSNDENIQPHPITTKYSDHTQPPHNQTQPHSISRFTSGVKNAKDAIEESDSDETTQQINFVNKSNLTPSIPKSRLYGADLQDPIRPANNSRSLGESSIDGPLKSTDSSEEKDFDSASDNSSTWTTNPPENSLKISNNTNATNEELSPSSSSEEENMGSKLVDTHGLFVGSFFDEKELAVTVKSAVRSMNRGVGSHGKPTPVARWLTTQSRTSTTPRKLPDTKKMIHDLSAFKPAGKALNLPQHPGSLPKDYNRGRIAQPSMQSRTLQSPATNKLTPHSLPKQTVKRPLGLGNRALGDDNEHHEAWTASKSELLTVKNERAKMAALPRPAKLDWRYGLTPSRPGTSTPFPNRYPTTTKQATSTFGHIDLISNVSTSPESIQHQSPKSIVMPTTEQYEEPNATTSKNVSHDSIIQSLLHAKYGPARSMHEEAETIQDKNLTDGGHEITVVTPLLHHATSVDTKEKSSTKIIFATPILNTELPASADGFSSYVRQEHEPIMATVTTHYSVNNTTNILVLTGNHSNSAAATNFTNEDTTKGNLMEVSHHQQNNVNTGTTASEISQYSATVIPNKATASTVASMPAISQSSKSDVFVTSGVNRTATRKSMERFTETSYPTTQITLAHSLDGTAPKFSSAAAVETTRSGITSLNENSEPDTKENFTPPKAYSGTMKDRSLVEHGNEEDSVQNHSQSSFLSFTSFNIDGKSAMGTNPISIFTMDSVHPTTAIPIKESSDHKVQEIVNTVSVLPGGTSSIDSQDSETKDKFISSTQRTYTTATSSGKKLAESESFEDTSPHRRSESVAATTAPLNAAATTTNVAREFSQILNRTEDQHEDSDDDDKDKLRLRETSTTGQRAWKTIEVVNTVASIKSASAALENKGVSPSSQNLATNSQTIQKEGTMATGSKPSNDDFSDEHVSTVTAGSNHSLSLRQRTSTNVLNKNIMNFTDADNVAGVRQLQTTDHPSIENSNSESTVTLGPFRKDFEISPTSSRKESRIETTNNPEGAMHSSTVLRLQTEVEDSEKRSEEKEDSNSTSALPTSMTSGHAASTAYENYSSQKLLTSSMATDGLESHNAFHSIISSTAVPVAHKEETLTSQHDEISKQWHSTDDKSLTNKVATSADKTDQKLPTTSFEQIELRSRSSTEKIQLVASLSSVSPSVVSTPNPESLELSERTIKQEIAFQGRGLVRKKNFQEYTDTLSTLDQDSSPQGTVGKGSMTSLPTTLMEPATALRQTYATGITANVITNSENVKHLSESTTATERTIPTTKHEGHLCATPNDSSLLQDDKTTPNVPSVITEHVSVDRMQSNSPPFTSQITNDKVSTFTFSTSKETQNGHTEKEIKASTPQASTIPQSSFLPSSSGLNGSAESEKINEKMNKYSEKQGNAPHHIPSSTFTQSPLTSTGIPSQNITRIDDEPRKIIMSSPSRHENVNDMTTQTNSNTQYTGISFTPESTEYRSNHDMHGVTSNANSAVAHTESTTPQHSFLVSSHSTMIPIQRSDRTFDENSTEFKGYTKTTTEQPALMGGTGFEMSSNSSELTQTTKTSKFDSTMTSNRISWKNTELPAQLSTTHETHSQTTQESILNTKASDVDELSKSQKAMPLQGRGLVVENSDELTLSTLTDRNNSDSDGATVPSSKTRTLSVEMSEETSSPAPLKLTQGFIEQNRTPTSPSFAQNFTSPEPTMNGQEFQSTKQINFSEGSSLHTMPSEVTHQPTEINPPTDHTGLKKILHTVSDTTEKLGIGESTQARQVQESTTSIKFSNAPAPVSFTFGRSSSSIAMNSDEETASTVELGRQAVKEVKLNAPNGAGNHVSAMLVTAISQSRSSPTQSTTEDVSPPIATSHVTAPEDSPRGPNNKYTPTDQNENESVSNHSSLPPFPLPQSSNQVSSLDEDHLNKMNLTERSEDVNRAVTSQAESSNVKSTEKTNLNELEQITESIIPRSTSSPSDTTRMSHTISHAMTTPNSKSSFTTGDENASTPKPSRKTQGTHEISSTTTSHTFNQDSFTEETTKSLDKENLEKQIKPLGSLMNENSRSFVSHDRSSEVELPLHLPVNGDGTRRTSFETSQPVSVSAPLQSASTKAMKDASLISSQQIDLATLTSEANKLLKTTETVLDDKQRIDHIEQQSENIQGAITTPPNFASASSQYTISSSRLSTSTNSFDEKLHASMPRLTQEIENMDFNGHPVLADRSTIPTDRDRSASTTIYRSTTISGLSKGSGIFTSQNSPTSKDVDAVKSSIADVSTLSTRISGVTLLEELSSSRLSHGSSEGTHPTKPSTNNKESLQDRTSSGPNSYDSSAIPISSVNPTISTGPPNKLTATSRPSQMTTLPTSPASGGSLSSSIPQVTLGQSHTVSSHKSSSPLRSNTHFTIETTPTSSQDSTPPSMTTLKAASNEKSNTQAGPSSTEGTEESPAREHLELGIKQQILVVNGERSLNGLLDHHDSSTNLNENHQSLTAATSRFNDGHSESTKSSILTESESQMTPTSEKVNAERAHATKESTEVVTQTIPAHSVGVRSTSTEFIQTTPVSTNKDERRIVVAQESTIADAPRRFSTASDQRHLTESSEGISHLEEDLMYRVKPNISAPHNGAPVNNLTSSPIISKSDHNSGISDIASIAPTQTTSPAEVTTVTSSSLQASKAAAQKESSAMPQTSNIISITSAHAYSPTVSTSDQKTVGSNTSLIMKSADLKKDKEGQNNQLTPHDDETTTSQATFASLSQPGMLTLSSSAPVQHLVTEGTRRPSTDSTERPMDFIFQGEDVVSNVEQTGESPLFLQEDLGDETLWISKGPNDTTASTQATPTSKINASLSTITNSAGTNPETTDVRLKEVLNSQVSQGINSMSSTASTTNYERPNLATATFSNHGPQTLSKDLLRSTSEQTAVGIQKQSTTFVRSLQNNTVESTTSFSADSKVTMEASATPERHDLGDVNAHGSAGLLNSYRDNQGFSVSVTSTLTTDGTSSDSRYYRSSSSPSEAKTSPSATMEHENISEEVAPAEINGKVTVASNVAKIEEGSHERSTSQSPSHSNSYETLKENASSTIVDGVLKETSPAFESDISSQLKLQGRKQQDGVKEDRSMFPLEDQVISIVSVPPTGSTLMPSRVTSDHSMTMPAISSSTIAASDTNKQDQMPAATREDASFPGTTKPLVTNSGSTKSVNEPVGTSDTPNSIYTGSIASIRLELDAQNDASGIRSETTTLPVLTTFSNTEKNSKAPTTTATAVVAEKTQTLEPILTEKTTLSSDISRPTSPLENLKSEPDAVIGLNGMLEPDRNKGLTSLHSTDHNELSKFKSDLSMPATSTTENAGLSYTHSTSTELHQILLSQMNDRNILKADTNKPVTVSAQENLHEPTGQLKSTRLEETTQGREPAKPEGFLALSPNGRSMDSPEHSEHTTFQVSTTSNAPQSSPKSSSATPNLPIADPAGSQFVTVTITNTRTADIQRGRHSNESSLAVTTRNPNISVPTESIQVQPTTTDLPYLAQFTPDLPPEVDPEVLIEESRRNAVTATSDDSVQSFNGSALEVDPEVLVEESRRNAITPTSDDSTQSTTDPALEIDPEVLIEESGRKFFNAASDDPMQNSTDSVPEVDSEASMEEFIKNTINQSIEASKNANTVSTMLETPSNTTDMSLASSLAGDENLEDRTEDTNSSDILLKNAQAEVDPFSGFIPVDSYVNSENESDAVVEITTVNNVPLSTYTSNMDSSVQLGVTSALLTNNSVSTIADSIYHRNHEDATQQSIANPNDDHEQHQTGAESSNPHHRPPRHDMPNRPSETALSNTHNVYVMNSHGRHKLPHHHHGLLATHVGDALVIHPAGGGHHEVSRKVTTQPSEHHEEKTQHVANAENALPRAAEHQETRIAFIETKTKSVVQTSTIAGVPNVDLDEGTNFIDTNLPPNGEGNH